MKPIRILVNSPGTFIGRLFEKNLSVSKFSLLNSMPGPAFMDLAPRAEIAVIDRIDERPNAAQLEIALLKKMHLKISIIVISRCSSDRDVPIVEQGIFYYLAGQPEKKLARVIQAAANVIIQARNEESKTKSKEINN